MIQLTEELYAAEMPNNFDKKDVELTLINDYTLPNKIPKGNYTILGEISTKDLIPPYSMYFDELNLFVMLELLKTKGCTLTTDNKFIILKLNK